MKRLSVDRDECVGSGHCIFAAPDIFELDEEGLVVLLQPEPATDREEAAGAAVRGCPASAIRIEDV